MNHPLLCAAAEVRATRAPPLLYIFAFLPMPVRTLPGHTFPRVDLRAPVQPIVSSRDQRRVYPEIPFG